MSPHTPVSLSPFCKGVCWHGVKPQEKLGPERFCGEFGELCLVSRPTERIERMFERIIRDTFKWGAASSAKVPMYLCRKHQKRLEIRGYLVTKVQEEEVSESNQKNNDITIL